MKIDNTDFNKALNLYISNYAIFEDLKVTASYSNTLEATENVFYVGIGWSGVAVHVSENHVEIFQIDAANKTGTSACFTDHISMNMLCETLNHFIAGVYVYDKVLRKALAVQALNS